MQSENRVVAVDIKQQTTARQGHRIRLALECMAGESLASRLRQCSQGASESAGPIDADRCNTGNRNAVDSAPNADPVADSNLDADAVPDNCNADKPNTVEDELNFSQVDDIRRALYALCTRQDKDLAAQLELLVRFDDLEGWRESGVKSCVAWMNASLCIDRRTAWERLRVGRQLRLLPIIQRLFRNGRLSWSKVRLLTRIANPDNEQMLAHASLDASVSDVQRLCDEYRWPADEDESTDEGKARQQYERRRLSWRQLHDGNTQIQLVLPPEKAQNFLHSIEHCEDLLYNEALDSQVSATSDTGADTQADTQADTLTDTQTDTDANTDSDKNPAPDNPISATQRRADAAVLMAERSLAFRGDDLAPADRYQVVVNVDAASLAQPVVAPSAPGQADASSEITSISASNAISTNSEITAISATGASSDVTLSSATSTGQPAIPVRKPLIEGSGSITVATARQIACDCSLITLLSEEGEPLSIGRKSRLWPAPMRRAILTRDRHCQFSGCDSHRFLQIHHIVHWADGGETSIENGVALCQHHHQLIHSGEYLIERATVVTPDTENALTQGLFPSSKRSLLPSRCRFRVTRRKTHRQNHEQTNSQVSDTCTAHTCTDHTCTDHTYTDQTPPINECRDGDKQWEYNCCNTSTRDTVFNASADSFDDQPIIKTVHSSHRLHVDTVGHGSHFLSVQAASGSAERYCEQLPP